MVKYIDTKETAKIVRKLLKESFPGVKFSVRMSAGSMYSGIDIRYEDGPALKAVEALVGRFRGNYFDGMQDINVPCKPDTWEGEQVRWGCTYAPSVERRVSIPLASRVDAYIRQYWADSVLATFKLVIDEERGSWYVDGDYDETQIFYEKLNATDVDDPFDAEADRQRDREREARELKEYEEQRAWERAEAERHAAAEAEQLAAVRAVMKGVECREVTPYFVTAQFSGFDKLQTLEEFREKLSEAIARKGAEACTRRVRICYELELSLEQFQGLSSTLWDEWAFLDGKGGHTPTSPMPPVDRRGNRDPEAMRQWRAGIYFDNSVLVKCRTGQQIVIDPEGYSWAHVVGLNVRSKNSEADNVVSLASARAIKHPVTQAATPEKAEPAPNPLDAAYRAWIDRLIAAGNFEGIRSFEEWQQPYTKSAYEAWVIDLHQRQVYGQFKSYPEWLDERLQPA